MLKIKDPTCFECGQSVSRLIENVPGLVFIEQKQDENDTFEYVGETEMLFDLSEPVKDGIGRSLVGCSQSHEWYTTVTEE